MDESRVFTNVMGTVAPGENFCPNYDGDMVQLSQRLFPETKNSPRTLRIIVDGKDDLMFVKDYVNPTLSDCDYAENIVNILKKGNVSIRQLYELGFITE